MGNGVIPTTEITAPISTPKVDGIELVDEGVSIFYDSKGNTDMHESSAVIVYPGDREHHAVVTKQTGQSKTLDPITMPMLRAGPLHPLRVLRGMFLLLRQKI